MGRTPKVPPGPLARHLPRWNRSLDMVALTHLDADHGRGLLEVLDRYRVAAVLVGVEYPESAFYPQWRATLDRQRLQVMPVSAGYRILLEEDVTLEVLNPPPRPFRGSPSDRNNNGLVLRLVYGDVSFLLAADIEALAENNLVGSAPVLESVVLKVPHHGSKTSSTVEFLGRVKPSQVVISAGVENQYGHPHAEVVARLEETSGVTEIYRTGQRGSIEFSSDGRRLWVKTQR